MHFEQINGLITKLFYFHISEEQLFEEKSLKLEVEFTSKQSEVLKDDLVEVT